VAELHVTDTNFPWLNARVVPLPGFEQVAPLFEEEARLLDELADVESPEWTAAYKRVRIETRQPYPDGRDVPEYQLHIEGEHAWWRWSDEPFSE
jgi:hypothetical protein